MRAQPEALRLAVILETRRMDDVADSKIDLAAADELRRLYAEVDRLSYQLAYPDNFAREPLTDEEIVKITADPCLYIRGGDYRIDIARAIEAAHGIKGDV